MTCATQIRLRHVVRNTVAKSTGEPESFIGLEDIAGGAGRLVAQGVAEKAATDALVFEPGDVLFGKLRPYLAKSLAPTDRGTCTSELLVMRPGPRLDARFLLYLTLSEPWLDWAVTTSCGTKMPRTSWEAMADFAFTLPPLGEQRRIADFLDTETARLDASERARRAQMVLLEERRWSAFDDLLRTVDAPLVPVRRALNRITDGPFGSAFTSDSYCDEGAVVVRLGNIGFDEYRSANEARIPLTLYRQFLRHQVLPGDVLIAGLGDAANHAGRACVAPDLGPAMVKGKCFAARARDDVALPGYLSLVFSSPVGRDAFTSRGSTRQMINLEVVRSALIPLPDLGTQGEIVRRMAQREAVRRRAHDQLGRGVALLSERRQALITAAVTGQLDVSTARQSAP